MLRQGSNDSVMDVSASGYKRDKGRVSHMSRRTTSTCTLAKNAISCTSVKQIPKAVLSGTAVGARLIPRISLNSVPHWFQDKFLHPAVSGGKSSADLRCSSFRSNPRKECQSIELDESLESLNEYHFRIP